MSREESLEEQNSWIADFLAEQDSQLQLDQTIQNNTIPDISSNVEVEVPLAEAYEQLNLTKLQDVEMNDAEILVDST